VVFRGDAGVTKAAANPGKRVHNNASTLACTDNRHRGVHNAGLPTAVERGTERTATPDDGRTAMTDTGTRPAGVHPGATLGAGGPGEPTIGEEPTVRSGTVVYADVTIGDRFTTGHGAVVREATTVGDDVLVGTHAVVDGSCRLGDGVSLQTGVYLPTGTTVGDRAFFGPHAVLTNDPYPLRDDRELTAPTVEADASIGANATVMPGVTVGERAFVAANAVVTEDVPPETLAVGAPASHEPLPAVLQGGNDQR
jgi:acetyltransferase-like isoleucine patch superfamily enzyme